MKVIIPFALPGLNEYIEAERKNRYKGAGMKRDWQSRLKITTRGRRKMRNIDRIKDLEKELGRYRKKVEDQQKKIKELNEQVDTARAGLADFSMAVDAILASTAILYGTEIPGGDADDVLGYRLTFPRFSPHDILSRYEVRTRAAKETGNYIAEVMEREDSAYGKH